MKAFLMYRDRDFGPKEDPMQNAADLTQDLELDTLLRAMAAGDDFLLEVAKTAVLASLHEPEEILYRQHILADCQEQSDIVRRDLCHCSGSNRAREEGLGLGVR